MAQQAQLFLPNGSLVTTVSLAMPDGKWPLTVEHAGFTYVLQNGRYVRANMVSAEAVGLTR